MKKFLAALAGVALLGTGCATQTYGSHMLGHTLSEGATRADVYANLGEPDSIFKSDDSEVLVYKGYKGVHYAYLYAKVKRIDNIVVMDKSGVVLTVQEVEAGKGHGYPAFPLLDPMFPVGSGELKEGPENYKIVNE